MEGPLDTSLNELTDIQRQAVEWQDGALLVLAGPGSGKTRVLTCRIASLLDRSPDERFRVLALTFTNKAANEMSGRVTGLVPGLDGRATIDTFHGFCAQVLRQHGVHVGIKPDFAIFSRTEDRQAVLEDAVRHHVQGSSQTFQLLPVIDDLKRQLVAPDAAEQCLGVMKVLSAEDVRRVALAYRLYEEELRRINALDFNSLILGAYQLFAYPAVARQYQRAYKYWLLDEFQDTNGAQYALLRRMAGQSFRQIFAVADDDQTVFEWNGANVERIKELVKDFSCEIVQLPTNFRCPPRIVEAANRLIVYNSRRMVSKHTAMSVASSQGLPSIEEQIQSREFATDEDEIAGISVEIAGLDVVARGQTAVLARNRSLLEAMHKALGAADVPSVVPMRRDDFLSPQMRWFVACLKQIDRPLDLRNMAALAEAFGGFASSPLDWNELVSRSESHGVTCFKIWVDALRDADLSPPIAEVVNAVADLSVGELRLGAAIERVLDRFEGSDPEGDLKDLKEDLSAWRRIERQIKHSKGSLSLDRFLQELELRPKEPPPAPGTVALATIHGAKGQEFDTVYLIGLANEILPSWQSLNRGDGSAALEEERRACFVAITRTRRRLVLSRAREYNGWHKRPSRFLEEMGCLGTVGNTLS